jgi:aspartate aminotransferase
MPSTTLAMSAKANLMKSQGIPVINLAVGEPDYDTPLEIKEAAHKAMMDGKTKYTDVNGIRELREAIAIKLERENNLKYNIDEIIVSSGAKQVIFNALFATINPGDEVIVPAPYWLSYIDMILLLGGKPVIVSCDEENNFKLTAAQLKKNITSKTKWVIINSPNNPTGAVYSYEDLQALAQVLIEYPNIFILSDDIYEYLIFDDKKFYSLAQIPELFQRTLTVNGFSKSYAMTGWRLGYGAGPKELIQKMALIQSHTTSHPNSIAQYAVIDVLKYPIPFVYEKIKLMESKRNLFISLLREIPKLQIFPPEGAFYIWIDCKDMMKDRNLKNSHEMSMYFLEKSLVVGAAGAAFGNDDYIRFSYATSEQNLIKAAEMIKNICSI